ncbi:MAG: IS1182 family transposase [Pirellulaceae bacterium]
MMVGYHARTRNAGCRFADPLWNDQSPEWLAFGEHLGADHPVKMIDSAMSQLDLTSLYESYSDVGSQAHRPDLLVRIICFELQQGRRKPSQWWADCRDNIAVRWLGRGIQPSRTSWYEFRDRFESVVDELNQHVLGQAIASEMTQVTRAALDGTAVAANASRRRLTDMLHLEQRIEQLEAIVKEDERRESPAEIPAWMATTPATRVGQLARFQKARQRLRRLHEENDQQIPSRRKKKIVINTADPEAALGLDKEHVFRPLYTVQTVRDLDSQFILGYEVFAQATDTDTLKPMVERVTDLTGRHLDTLLVDCGYVTGYDLAVSKELQICLYGPWKENDYSPAKGNTQFRKDQFTWLHESDTYRCPAGQILKRIGTETRLRSGGRSELLIRYACPVECCQACSLRAQCTTSQKAGRSLRRSEHEHLIEAHRANMATDEAKQLYRLRGQSIEIVFADFKEHRNLRRFSGRGLQRARGEVASLVLCHNLLLLQRSRQARENTAAQATEPWQMAA